MPSLAVLLLLLAWLIDVLYFLLCFALYIHDLFHAHVLFLDCVNVPLDMVRCNSAPCPYRDLFLSHDHVPGHVPALGLYYAHGIHGLDSLIVRAVFDGYALCHVNANALFVQTRSSWSQHRVKCLGGN